MGYGGWSAISFKIDCDGHDCCSKCGDLFLYPDDDCDNPKEYDWNKEDEPEPHNCRKCSHCGDPWKFPDDECCDDLDTEEGRQKCRDNWRNIPYNRWSNVNCQGKGYGTGRPYGVGIFDLNGNKIRFQKAIDDNWEIYTGPVPDIIKYLGIPPELITNTSTIPYGSTGGGEYGGDIIYNNNGDPINPKTGVVELLTQRPPDEYPDWHWDLVDNQVILVPGRLPDELYETCSSNSLCTSKTVGERCKDENGSLLDCVCKKFERMDPNDHTKTITEYRCANSNYIGYGVGDPIFEPPSGGGSDGLPSDDDNKENDVTTIINAGGNDYTLDSEEKIVYITESCGKEITKVSEEGDCVNKITRTTTTTSAYKQSEISSNLETWIVSIPSITLEVNSEIKLFSMGDRSSNGYSSFLNTESDIEYLGESLKSFFASYSVGSFSIEMSDTYTYNSSDEDLDTKAIPFGEFKNRYITNYDEVLNFFIESSSENVSTKNTIQGVSIYNSADNSVGIESENISLTTNILDIDYSGNFTLKTNIDFFMSGSTEVEKAETPNSLVTKNILDNILIKKDLSNMNDISIAYDVSSSPSNSIGSSEYMTDLIKDTAVDIGTIEITKSTTPTYKKDEYSYLSLYEDSNVSIDRHATMRNLNDFCLSLLVEDGKMLEVEDSEAAFYSRSDIEFVDVFSEILFNDTNNIVPIATAKNLL